MTLFTGLINASALYDLQLAAAGSFRNVVRDADHIMALLRDLNDSLQTGDILRNKRSYADILTQRSRAIVNKDFDETFIPWFLLDK